MSQGFRQSQATLHTWSGLLVGWMLYLIFLNGAISYWRDEVSRWMRPELGAVRDAPALVRGATAFLSDRAPQARQWTIELPNERGSGAWVAWQPKEVAERPRRGASGGREATIGADGQPVRVRDTRGGDFFYRMHFDLHYLPIQWARWFVSFCTMFMLVAMLSGVIAHKKIFADFFTFRRGKGQRSWLDGHNALAVLSLPFHLMITYTGLITLMTVYMPWAALANYDDRMRLFDDIAPRNAPVKPTGVAAALPDLAAIVRAAETHWGGGHVGALRIDYPGDAAMRVTALRRTSDQLPDRNEPLEFDGQGRLTRTSPEPSSSILARDGMIGLHAARFAPTAMRWLFFLAGVAGTLMVASGLVLWTVKRRERLADPQRPPLGFRTVERLNIAFVAGLPLASLAFLWSNRWLPIAMDGRADREIAVYFVAWGTGIVHACVRPVRRAWAEQWAVAALMAVALPLRDLFAADTHLPARIATGDYALAAIDAALVVIGVAFGWLARQAHRAQAVARARVSPSVADPGQANPKQADPKQADPTLAREAQT